MAPALGDDDPDLSFVIETLFLDLLEPGADVEDPVVVLKFGHDLLPLRGPKVGYVPSVLSPRLHPPVDEFGDMPLEAVSD